MTTAEAAVRLGCSPAHVAKLVKDGKLRGRLLTRRLYLVDRASVEEYAAQPVTVGWKRGRPRKRREGDDGPTQLHDHD